MAISFCPRHFNVYVGHSSLRPNEIKEKTVTKHKNNHNTLQCRHYRFAALSLLARARACIQENRRFGQEKTGYLG